MTDTKPELKDIKINLCKVILTIWAMITLYLGLIEDWILVIPHQEPMAFVSKFGMKIIAILILFLFSYQYYLHNRYKERKDAQ